MCSPSCPDLQCLPKPAGQGQHRPAVQPQSAPDCCAEGQLRAASRHCLFAERQNLHPCRVGCFTADWRTPLHAQPGQNYPFQFDSNFPSAVCSATSCPRMDHPGQRIFRHPGPRAGRQCGRPVPARHPSRATTPYTEDYNLAIQRSVAKGIVATVTMWATHPPPGSLTDPNSPLALENPSNSTQNARRCRIRQHEFYRPCWQTATTRDASPAGEALLQRKEPAGHLHLVTLPGRCARADALQRGRRVPGRRTWSRQGRNIPTPPSIRASASPSTLVDLPSVRDTSFLTRMVC